LLCAHGSSARTKRPYQQLPEERALEWREMYLRALVFMELNLLSYRHGRRCRKSLLSCCRRARADSLLCQLHALRLLWAPVGQAAKA
jgi:hypothetical protein